MAKQMFPIPADVTTAEFELLDKIAFELEGGAGAPWRYGFKFKGDHMEAAYRILVMLRPKSGEDSG